MSRLFGMVTTAASRDYTSVALDSFFRWTIPWNEDDSFVLIDNDHSWSQPGRDPRWPAVTVVANPQPFSFAQNVNQLIRLAALQNARAFIMNNDIVFTPHWHEPLMAELDAVLAPTSNQNFTYRTRSLQWNAVMTLEEYLGHEEELLALVNEHRRTHQNWTVAYKTNFFCFVVPPRVYQAVGLFDTRFGVAGGEDDDYCIRCYLHGLQVLVSESSYLLHFGGRSTWSGPETREEWQAREQHFIHIFERKWGKTLAQFLLYRDPSILTREPSLAAIQSQKGIAGLYTEMARRDGISIADRLKEPME